MAVIKYPALRLDGVCVDVETGRAPLRVLNEVNAAFHSGRLTLVTGPSGSGKSTLLAVAGLLVQPSVGNVWLGGTRVAKLDAERVRQLRVGHIGFVFQDHRLIERLNPIENILLAQAVTGGENVAQARNLLSQLQLDHVLTTPVLRLSGGERQRVSIARSLSGNPEVLLCDEPTAALDTASALNVAGVLRYLASERGRAVVVVTHDDRLRRFADEVLELADGRVMKLMKFNEKGAAVVE